MKPWMKKIGVAVGVVALVYGMVFVDVMLRARSAFYEGEKYWHWYEQPALKTAALNGWKADEFKRLDRAVRRGKITDEDKTKQREIVEAEYARRQKESAIKYAYIWYQTVVELFTPPESPWSRAAREKMPRAKELWKQELTARKVPFEEYMLE